MDIANAIILTFLISMIIQSIFFAFAATYKTDKVTDLSYGLTFVVITIFWLIKNSGTVGIFEILLATMITIWGIRIASYLVVRILKTGKDRRFDDMRDKPLVFARFWLLQGLSVWVIMIPAVYVFNSHEFISFGLFAWLGAIIWLIGLSIESIADMQLFNFRFNKANKGKWIDEGLWHNSRHPNYFGEMLVWWGLFIYGIGVYQNYGWLTVIGPIFITILLLFVSGIPLLEKSHDKRWGNDKNYQKYKNSTSLVFLLPKK